MTDQYVGNGLVACLDILGFTTAMQQNWSRALQKLLNIKKAALDPAVTFVVERPGQPDAPYPPMTQTFSDTILLLTKFPKYIPPLNRSVAFVSVARQMSIVRNAAIDEGFVLRGAIEMGEIYCSMSDATGPALAYADCLEKCKAVSARIILGPTLLRFLSFCEGNTEGYGNGWMRALVKSSDDLVALSPTFNARIGDLAKIEKIRSTAPDKKRQRKYDELIDLMKNEATARTPTYQDLKSSAQLLDGLQRV